MNLPHYNLFNHLRDSGGNQKTATEANGTIAGHELDTRPIAQVAQTHNFVLSNIGSKGPAFATLDPQLLNGNQGWRATSGIVLKLDVFEDAAGAREVRRMEDY